MVELFHAIAACADLIHYWDLAKRADGVVLRATSRTHCSTEQAAVDIARAIADRLAIPDRDVRVVSTVARTDGTAGWHAFVELVVG